MNCPHCETEIDEHEAGRETDVCIAIAVMGHMVRQRLCFPDPECGGWDEAESNYSRISVVDGFNLEALAQAKVANPTFIKPCYQDQDEIWVVVPEYSVYIAAAWEVVGRFFLYDVGTDGMLHICEIHTAPNKRFIASADDAPLAICRAALKATLA